MDLCLRIILQTLDAHNTVVQCGGIYYTDCMDSYAGNNKPYIYASFPAQRETEIDGYLEPLCAEGVLFYHGYTLTKDEKKRIEGAHAVLLFVYEEIYEDPKFREVVDYAVEAGKKILTVYVEKVEADAWGHMQLYSSQAIFKYECDDTAFSCKLKEAEIFRNMAVTPQQKRFKRNATISAWIFILVIAGFIYLMVSSPKIIQVIEQKQVKTSIVGLEGMTQKDLDEITELFIVANKVYPGRDQDPFQYDRGALHIKYDERGDITDLSELTKCRNLRKLTVIGNNITDITPITKMTKLISLTLDDNPIESIEGIENLTELRSLSLEKTNVKDLTPIAHLDDLQALNIKSTPVSELPDTGLAERLNSLDARDTEITSIPYLGKGKMDHLGVPPLEQKEGYLDFLKDKDSFGNLSLNRIPIEDAVNALKDKTVEDFDDSGLPITSVKELEPFNVFVKHSIGITAYDGLTSLDGIEAFDGLECISVHDCENITDISALLNLHSVRTLFLDGEMRPLAEEQLQGRYQDIKYDWDE